MENSMISGEQQVEQNIPPVTWRDWFFRILACLAVLQIFSMFFIRVFEIRVIAVFLLLPLMFSSLSFTLYYLYRAFKGEAERQRTVWAIVTFFLVWLMGCAYFIIEMFGDFQWVYIGSAIDAGRLTTLFWYGFEKSYLMIILFHVPIMLAFRKKRNASSVVNTILYWSCTLGFILVFLLLALTDA
tara:strand:- start:931 stop:1485 length:555 start_codon:yes stop_codon:yes gene_type:complete